MADITDQQFLSQDPEVLGLQRQRQLANLLTGQAFNQPQGQVISGHYVKPSALQQALPMINAAIGGMTNANLDTKQQAMADMLRGKEQDVVQRYMAAKTPQEQFTIANERYAPAQLKSSAYEKEIEYKLIINKKIPLFKKTFIDTFGLNNKSITAGDIVEFIREFLLGNVDSIKQQAKIKNFQSSKFAESERTRMGEDTIPPENSYLTIQNPRNNKNLYIMIVLDRGDALNVLWSTQLKRHTFREIMGSHSLDSIKEQTGLNIGEIKRFLGMNNNPFTIASKILKSHPDIVPISYDASTPPYESVDVEYDENIMGWGVKTEKIPDKVPFGKVYIMLHKLYYKNILSLRRPDKTNFIGFPNTPVSDEFVHMIMQMVQHNATPKAGELKKLKTVEQHLYNRLIAISQLHKSHEIDSNGTIEHLKHQMQLILGEIEAGNDSKKVKLQLHNVVHALKNMGAITQKDAIDFIKQF